MARSARGRRLVVIDGAVLGDPARAAELLAPLRALQPELDTLATVPAPALARLHGDPEDPVPSRSDSTMLANLPPEAVSAFVGAAGVSFTRTGEELVDLGEVAPDSPAERVRGPTARRARR